LPTMPNAGGLSVLDLDALEDTTDEPWHVDPKDKMTVSEIERQTKFVQWMAKHARGVDVLAIPNAGKATSWERLQRYREGARAGALDLIITWPGGVCFAEFKAGTTMPTPAQRERLNMYYRMGHHTGVFRTGGRLVSYLRSVGCPVPVWGS
jgi:hypothetical protein